MATDEEKRKAEELDNSRNLDVHTWSDYPEVNRAVAQIYEEFKELPDFEGKQNIQKKHIKVIILDLYVRNQEDPEGYLAFYRMKGMYEGESRYNKLHISYVSVSVIDHLEELGYLEQVKGYQDRSGARPSRISRMRAKDKLIDLILNKHKIVPGMVEKHPNTECIILRDKDGKNIEYTDTPKTKRQRQDLYRYNNLLRRTHIDVHSYPEEGAYTSSKKKRIKLDRNDKFVRRIYNRGSWDHGGRYYGGFWQRIPKEWRRFIRINGSPTVEVDYSGLHIILLYGKEGIDYWGTIGTDPYQLEKYKHIPQMRGFLKQLLLTVVNAESKTKAIQAMQYEINKDKEQYQWFIDAGIDIEDLIDEFAEAHNPIKEYFYGGEGVKLQNMDSRIAERIINQLSLETIPVLCVHDSFIVAEEHKERLVDLMVDSFKEELPEVDTRMIDNSMQFGGYTTWVPALGNPTLFQEEKDCEQENKKMQKRLEDHQNMNWSAEYYKEVE